MYCLQSIQISVVQFSYCSDECAGPASFPLWSLRRCSISCLYLWVIIIIILIFILFFNIITFNFLLFLLKKIHSDLLTCLGGCWRSPAALTPEPLLLLLCWGEPLAPSLSPTVVKKKKKKESGKWQNFSKGGWRSESS